MSNKALLAMLGILVVGTLTIIGVLVRSDQTWESGGSGDQHMAEKVVSAVDAPPAVPVSSPASHD